MKKSFDITTEILRVYESRKNEVLAAAGAGNAELAMSLSYELWMYMNRFRNCDLGVYYDEEIHDALESLNKLTHPAPQIDPTKTAFKIGFIITNFVDTGGASVVHRFLDNGLSIDGCTFQHHILVSNLSRRTDHQSTAAYSYIENMGLIDRLELLPPHLTWIDKAKRINQWVLDNQLDLVVSAPCPASIFALASRPAAFHAVLSQDCYTFTMGPGTGDLTFLVTTDQLFKYKFKGRQIESFSKIVLLPLHADDHIASRIPFDFSSVGIPPLSVVSGTTNLWKVCHGDTETLLEEIGYLVRRFENYHHVFAGTPRCLDCLESFLVKNPDLRGRIHFLGAFSNIYDLLGSVDFWINSFPTSGGSDIEAAMLGVPTIELVLNRNLNLHSVEFLRLSECDVISREEFRSLGARLISDPSYRADLGAHLRDRVSREFSKRKLLSDRLYRGLLEGYRRLPLKRATGLCIEDSINYEKHIAFYSAHVKLKCPFESRIEFLIQLSEIYPKRAFAWVKLVEEAIRSDDDSLYDTTVSRQSMHGEPDYRFLIMCSVASGTFGRVDDAHAYLARIRQPLAYDQNPQKLLAWLLSLEKSPGIIRAGSGRASGKLPELRCSEPSAPKQALEFLDLYYNY